MSTRDTQLTFPVGATSPTCLALPPNITEDQERSVITALRSIGRGVTWWMGDFALHYQGRKGEHYSKPLAEAWGVSCSTVQQAAYVARFYHPSRRHEALSWRHHMDAMRAAIAAGGGPDEAEGWLVKAEQGGWSCADLRQNACPPSLAADPREPETNPFAPLDEADKWATFHRGSIEELNAEKAAHLLGRLTSLAAVIDRLRQLTGANIVGRIASQ